MAFWQASLMISSKTKSKLVICMRVRRPASRKTSNNTRYMISARSTVSIRNLPGYTRCPILGKHELMESERSGIVDADATVQCTDVFRPQMEDDDRRRRLCVGFKCIKESVDADA